MFRFYDPVVIIPILKAMDERDRLCFLGNIESWSLWDGDRQRLYSNSATQQFALQEAPWWKIKETHLTPKEDLTHIASNIERRLWATLPQAMNALPRPKRFIESALHQFKSAQRDAEDAQLFVLSCLTKESKIDINDIALAMHLSSTEVEQLNTFIRELT
ncbi:hypothetical protein QF117_10825 [Vibrio sp. YMD68]|uniref:hypothetical protein n=1 Tax=Vibrio sp. YMD68 TaxID=3042300 RepID=UPI00249B33A2|nr:hypothetical protein [Vibrio sp. YMD68]WGW01281.1 hypothetical protein QF117_10825 [Vibrio sp. YMD68]